MPAQKKQQRRERTIKTKTQEAQGWSLKPDDELKELMAEAMLATGTPRQQLIFECIRRELPEVVKLIVQERQAAQKAFATEGETKKK
jgi:spore coat polysaccharide biosynthesis predicted glycosyltransferase SpsG